MARSRVLLVFLALLSLVLVTTCNRLAAAGLRTMAAPDLLWVAGLCVPSLVACALIYLGVRPERPFGAPIPETRWPRVLRLAGTWLVVWLIASTVAATVAGHWIRYASGAPAIACFVVVGPLQEEVLFRGALFELAERGCPGRRAALPVLLTTVPFCLQHFQFHGYRADASALGQVAFTIPMGLVFGRLRSETGSLWPGVVVHVLTNLPGAFGD